MSTVNADLQDLYSEAIHNLQTVTKPQQDELIYDDRGRLTAMIGNRSTKEALGQNEDRSERQVYHADIRERMREISAIRTNSVDTAKTIIEELRVLQNAAYSEYRGLLQNALDGDCDAASLYDVARRLGKDVDRIALDIELYASYLSQQELREISADIQQRLITIECQITDARESCQEATKKAVKGKQPLTQQVIAGKLETAFRTTAAGLREQQKQLNDMLSRHRVHISENSYETYLGIKGQ